MIILTSKIVAMRFQTCTDARSLFEVSEIIRRGGLMIPKDVIGVMSCVEVLTRLGSCCHSGLIIEHLGLITCVLFGILIIEGLCHVRYRMVLDVNVRLLNFEAEILHLVSLIRLELYSFHPSLKVRS